MSTCNLILGSNSPLGQYLIKSLPNSRVAGFQRLPGHGDASYYPFNLSDTEQNFLSFEKFINDVVEKHICVTLIAYSKIHQAEEKPGEHEIAALEQLLKLAATAGKTTSIFFCSSISVYGMAEIDPLTERCKTNPQTDYAKGKLNVENFIKSCFERESIHSSIIARIPCLVGPNFRGNFLRPIIDNNRNGNISEVSYVSRPFNSVIDYGSLAKLIRLLGYQSSRSFELINVASWPPTNLKHVLEKAGYRYKVTNNYPNPPKLIDVSKMVKLLGAIRSTEDIFGDIL